ncbi:hypothetical protein FA95DRAFT_1607624 [Auriscalpium vulgare]|uniref:Uncharacterized protein n=1 Tax=Auriscalpium vulgare TaxID=40419 RepID=A0ACB8RPQ5_9AGAM|nr:hypothetical protein FA95DRAFT_1607624 [Auriscalpium vulgare]
MATTPLDIHVVIIEWVYRSSQHAAIDYPTLRACALVCRAWTPIAQRLLFRRVPVPKGQLLTSGSNVMPRLVRTLRTAAHLAAHVRSFNIELATVTFNVRPEASVDALEALALCTNVDGVTIDLFGATAAFIAYLDTLPVRPSYLSVSGRDREVDHVIQLWPSVHVLDMASFPTEDIHVRMPHQLQALATSTLNMRKYCCAPNTVVPAGLQDLELNCHGGLFSPTSAALVASGLAAQLRSLYLFGHGAEVLPPAVLEKLAVLESLVLDCLPTEVSGIASGLPKNLRHFGYHFHDIGHERSEKLQILLDAARALPKLDLFTATRDSSQEVLEEIERWCREGGVELVVYPELGCFRRPRHVDWI